MPDPLNIRSLLSSWLRKSGLAADLRPYVIGQRWSELVGERIASHCRPTFLKHGVLTVEVDNSAWLNELSFLRKRLLDAINAGLSKAGPDGMADPGRGRISKLRLVVGRRRPASPIERRAFQPKPAPTPPSQHAVERAAEELAAPTDGLPSELRSAIYRARAAQLDDD